MQQKFRYCAVRRCGWGGVAARGAAWLLLGWGASAAGGTVAVDLAASGQEFLVRNESEQPVVPRLIIRGWTESDAFPARHATGLRLNGQAVAADMRAQGWLAVAAGARGITFYAYFSDHPNVFHCRDRHWRKTPRWDGVGRLFGEIKPLSPLLLQLKPWDDADPALLSVDRPKLVTRLFRRRDVPDADLAGAYAVLVNWAHEDREEAPLQGTLLDEAEVVWNLKSGKPIAPDKPLVLEPGEGTVLWLGARRQPRTDAGFIKARFAEWREKYGME